MQSRASGEKFSSENFLSLVYFTLDGIVTTPTLVITPPPGRGLPSAGEAESFFLRREIFFSQKKSFVAVRRRRNPLDKLHALSYNKSIEFMFDNLF